MHTAMTRSRQMTRNSDTWENFLLWFIEEFGFNPNIATALYDVQMLNSLSAMDGHDRPLKN